MRRTSLEETPCDNKSYVSTSVLTPNFNFQSFHKMDRVPLHFLEIATCENIHLTAIGTR